MAAKSVLAEHILYEHFGAVVGIVGSALLARGRLSYPTLLRLCSDSLKRSDIQAALLCLVQHNCVHHVVDEDEGLEYYTISVDEVLARRQYGLYLLYTRENWGSKAQEAVMQVLLAGKLKLVHLLDAMLGAPNSSDKHTQLQAMKNIYDLLDNGILKPVTANDQTAVEDQDLQYLKLELRKIKGAVQAKHLKAAKDETIEHRKTLGGIRPSWGQDVLRYNEICRNLGILTPQSKLSDTASHISKKRKYNGVDGNLEALSELTAPFDLETHVRVVGAQFITRLRNEAIVKGVRQQRGQGASRLVQELLTTAQSGLDRLDDRETTAVSLQHLVETSKTRSPTRRAANLPEAEQSGESEGEHPFHKLFSAQPAVSTLAMQHSGMWSRSDNSSDSLVNEILHHANLSCDKRKLAFTESISENGKSTEHVKEPKEKVYSWLKCDYEPRTMVDAGDIHTGRQAWLINFSDSAHILQLGLLERFIKHRFGKEAFRVWRVVDAKGKMEEKQIAKIAMTQTKVVREQVARLAAEGLLQQQEVPRTLDRNPSRTFFLWHVQRETCYAALANNLYNALVNLCVRQNAEKSASRAILRKSERRDVRENIGVLERSDRDALADLNWRIESIGVAAERINRDILILEWVTRSEET